MNDKFWNDAMNDELNLDSEGEVLMLMSMALDGLLNQEEEARFQWLLASDPQAAATWEDWQRIETRFTHVVHAEPPANFVAQFEERLALQESSQVWWSNFIMVAASLVILCGTLAGVAALGVNAYQNQAQLGSGLIHTLTGFFATGQQWLSALRIALSTSATPQTLALAVGYVCAGAAAMLWWIHFLRTSTQVVEAQQMTN